MTAFAVYRTTSPEAVALASRHLNVWLGCLNTVVLLDEQPDDGTGGACSPVAAVPAASHVA